MNTTVVLRNKPLRVELSTAAARALDGRTAPLLVEMELYFSCLIRKRVRFREAAVDSDWVPVNKRLSVRFYPVMTATCATDYAGDEPPLTEFPIVRADAFSPDWLKLDFRRGEWRGEFGFA